MAWRRRAPDPASRSLIRCDCPGLFVLETEDALGNTVTAEIDYVTLSPWKTTDPNGNSAEVAFDAAGRVTAAAVRGKDGDSDGDTLAEPTMTYSYVDDAWVEDQKPCYVETQMRETHGDSGTRWLVSRAYTGGGG